MNVEWVSSVLVFVGLILSLTRFIGSYSRNLKFVSFQVVLYIIRFQLIVVCWLCSNWCRLVMGCCLFMIGVFGCVVLLVLIVCVLVLVKCCSMVCVVFFMLVLDRKCGDLGIQWLSSMISVLVGKFSSYSMCQLKSGFSSVVVLVVSRQLVEVLMLFSVISSQL